MAMRTSQAGGILTNLEPLFLFFPWSGGGAVGAFLGRNPIHSAVDGRPLLPRTGPYGSCLVILSACLAPFPLLFMP